MSVTKIPLSEFSDEKKAHGERDRLERENPGEIAKGVRYKVRTVVRKPRGGVGKEKIYRVEAEHDI